LRSDHAEAQKPGGVTVPADAIGLDEAAVGRLGHSLEEELRESDERRLRSGRVGPRQTSVRIAEDVRGKRVARIVRGERRGDLVLAHTVILPAT
jgi:hypothetical protein